MTDIILKIYDYMKAHKLLCVLSFALISVLLTVKVLNLNYKEDISDFLPIGNNSKEALNIYQSIAGADKLFAIVQYKDSAKNNPDVIADAVSRFTDDMKKRDKTKMVRNVMSQVDMEAMSEVADFVYTNIPLFLEDKDYARIDSLLAVDNYVGEQLERDKQMLLFPGSGLLSGNIQRDPLNLFTPVVAKLQNSSQSLNYSMYDGYIFSPDMKKAFVVMSSSFGASETENNGKLLAMLKTSAETVMRDNPDLDIHIIGGPAIAVGNATQIKTDSVVAVALSVSLILILLFVAFRNVKNILLIALSIGWGWLFAMGCLSFVHDDISIIVIGISSVILGIAVNYPLHLIAHLSHTTNIRHALKEIVMPLAVGNITTVGAFLALVPLQSVALRDLGLFSSFLLIGTIVFVLLYLPHLVKARKQVSHESTFINRLGGITMENKPILVYVVVLLTLFFGYYSLQTKFDTDMSHINYMTDEQKNDLAYFQKNMTVASTKQSLYIVSTDSSFESALDKSLLTGKQIKGVEKYGKLSTCNQFIVSEKEQSRRLKLWQAFLSKYGDRIETVLAVDAARQGFANDSFDDFTTILHADYQTHEMGYFDTLSKTVFANSLVLDSVNSKYSVVDVLMVEKSQFDNAKSYLDKHHSDDYYYFDVQSMNSSIANNLSNNFNYIGWACGFIVLFFLWFSFGSFELAALSFIPMAVSWIWILGLMALMDIQFNIVNIILATFIFGQGDDYTIFMTEGSCYEYAYRKKMLASYKSSIIISALIMFIGIGTLIVAKHPALHSLAEVTIVGMFSVVLMAYLFPPLIFNWLVKNRQGYRVRPISVKPLLVMALSAVVFFVQLLSAYLLGLIMIIGFIPCKKRKAILHRYVKSLFLFDLKHIPTVKFAINNPHGVKFDKPSIIISNHQSMLDSACFMALCDKCVIVANRTASMNVVVRIMFRWLDFYTISDDLIADTEALRQRVEQGYSIVIFPEGERNAKSSILRFHKGAFYLAEQFNLDIIPVLLHGVNDVLPRNSVMVYPGSVSLDIEQVIKTDADVESYVSLAKRVHNFYVKWYSEVVSRAENAHYYKHLVLDRYRYKGVQTYRTVKKRIKKYDCYDKWIAQIPQCEKVVVLNNGFGEFSLLLALTHPKLSVVAIESDEECRLLAQYSAERIVENLQIEESFELHQAESADGTRMIILQPTDSDKNKYSEFNPIIVE